MPPSPLSLLVRWYYNYCLGRARAIGSMGRKWLLKEEEKKKPSSSLLEQEGHWKSDCHPIGVLWLVFSTTESRTELGLVYKITGLNSQRISPLLEAGDGGHRELADRRQHHIHGWFCQSRWSPSNVSSHWREEEKGGNIIIIPK